MPRIRIHQKMFAFKINPQNTVTLCALRCNDFQPLMRYFCQKKLLLPANKQTLHLVHLNRCVSNATCQPYWGARSDGEHRVGVLASLHRLCVFTPESISTFHPNQHSLLNTVPQAGTNQKWEKRWLNKGDGEQMATPEMLILVRFCRWGNVSLLKTHGMGWQPENLNWNSIQQEGKFHCLISAGDVQFRLASVLCQVLSDGDCTLYFEMPASPKWNYTHFFPNSRLH